MNAEIETTLTIKVEYVPPRPAPHCSNPDDSRFSDPGDGGELYVEVEGDLPRSILTRLATELEGAAGRDWVVEQIDEELDADDFEREED